MAEISALLRDAVSDVPAPDVEAILRRGRRLRRQQLVTRAVSLSLAVGLVAGLIGTVTEHRDDDHRIDTIEQPSPSTPLMPPTPSTGARGPSDELGIGAVAEPVLPGSSTDGPTGYAEPSPPTAPNDDRDLWLTFEHHGDIWVRRLDGSDQRRLTSDGTNSAPSWSPDGKHIVFTSGVSGNREIWVMNADGTDQRMLTGEDAPKKWSAAWSPDGRTIVYSATVLHESHLYLMNADGSSQRMISSRITGLYPQLQPSWSADGRRIVFNAEYGADAPVNPTSETPQYLGIYVWDIDDSGSGVRGEARRIGTGYKPDWSSDGQITYQCPDGTGSARICVMAEDGSGARLLPASRPEFEQLEPFWSPDASRIFFSERDSASDTTYLASVRPDGTDHRRLQGRGGGRWADAVHR